MELPSNIKIHSVVNVSKVQKYRDQVKDQRKEQPALVITKGKKEYKIEKIKSLEEKIRYLVQ